MIFCTLFNWVYLPQGIALYWSLERTCNSDFVLYTLCIDDFTASVLRELNFRRLKIIRLGDINDDRLNAAQANRTIAEFCWTCTTPLLLHLQDRHGSGAIISYVDADLHFFSDPAIVLNELGSRSILIHEHDFAPEHAHLQQSAGRFNVGLIAVRNDRQGRACLEKWQEQCLQECVYDPAAGKCGDQNYLDEWPQLYPELVICSNPGVGLAPWNITKHRLGSNGSDITVDGRPVVFYHFHSLRLLRPRLGVKPLVTASGNYVIDDAAIDFLYRSYARRLWRAVSRIERTQETAALGYTFIAQFPTLPREYQKLRNSRLYFSFAGLGIPSEYNEQLMSWLYGIDASKSSL